MKKNLGLKSFAFFTVLFVLASCCGFFGDNDLGNNFSLLDGDRVEDRTIVYCTGKSGGCCNSGIPVIPSKTDSLTNYVLSAASDRNWIIAKSKSKGSTHGFWIINKDFKAEFEYDDGGKLYETIQAHVVGPLNELEFKKQCEKKHITLKFEE